MYVIKHLISDAVVMNCNLLSAGLLNLETLLIFIYLFISSFFCLLVVQQINIKNKPSYSQQEEEINSKENDVCSVTLNNIIDLKYHQFLIAKRMFW